VARHRLASRPRRRPRRRERQLHAARHEGRPARPRRVLVGGADPRDAPVGDPDRARPAGAHLLVEHVDDLGDRHVRIVAMRQVEIESIDAETLERALQVAAELVDAQATRARLGVAALADQDHLDPARSEPVADPLLHLAVAVDRRGVDRVHAPARRVVEETVDRVAIQLAQVRAPEHEPRQGARHVRDSSAPTSARVFRRAFSSRYSASSARSSRREISPPAEGAHRVLR
jgi:hypothetical protein